MSDEIEDHVSMVGAIHISPRPQGIFVYGTLMAEELLAWLLTGSAKNAKSVLPIRQPATLTHYRRVAVHGCDYPALIPGCATDSVDGFLVVPSSKQQWKKIDDFEGDIYRRHLVQVYLPQSGKMAEAEAHLWQADVSKLLPNKPWDFSEFCKQRLENWLDLFQGIDMLGSDESS